MINGVISNDSLTTLINTISTNINNINSSTKTISDGLNSLTNYIGINTISGKINGYCNIPNYNGLTMKNHIQNLQTI